MPERLECEVLQKARYINTLTFTLYLLIYSTKRRRTFGEAGGDAATPRISKSSRVKYVYDNNSVSVDVFISDL